MNSQYDFNRELNKLIEKAASKGYALKDGKFEITTQEKVPVMEMFFIYNTTYEDTGRWYIYKETVKISDEDYKKMLEYGKKYYNYHYDSNGYKINYSTEYEGFYKDVIADIVRKYDKSRIDYINGNRGGTVFVWHDEDHEYYDKEGYTDYVDLWFSKEEDDDDFPRGYISFYEMPLCDFVNAEHIDMCVKKYIRDN